ncbi:MAC/perforin domain-containing protein [Hufsiella ginkgonis]|uniref:MACPF domain-containing protein n=1 Tax=Hufsiella ginkgonis TaxID=2695274 RepID=A0A7K1Y0H6_9SPHI|nr:MAC/perforin domain-containing protein [Hufsiella ginkgonis]MXV16509.1 hypothetical protein [Hufsiella ginkgonis]
MKKQLFAIALMMVVASCKKTAEVPHVPVNKISSKVKMPAGVRSAGDGVWDVLGYGYDLTGEYAHSNSATYQIIDVAQMDLDHPTLVENSGAETGTDQLVYGYNAANYLHELSVKINATGGTDLLLKGTIDAHFTDTQKFSSKYIYGSYGKVAIKRRVYMPAPLLSLIKSYRTADFLNIVQNESAATIVAIYGTHLLTNVALGGKLELIYKAETSSSDRTSAANAGVQMKFLGIFNLNTTGTSYTSSQGSSNFNETAFVRTVGGNAGAAIIGTVTFNGSGTPSATYNTAAWSAGVTDANAEMIDIAPGSLIPIYDLIDDPTKKADVQNYITQYLATNNVTLTPDPVYEFYSPSLNNHALDLDINLPAAHPGWNYNAQPFKAFTSQVAGSVPVYQFLHTWDGSHVYTRNPYPGWSNYINDGVAFYAYATQVAGSVPAYEFYHAGGHNHFYSTNINASAPYAGWAYNGLPFYVMPN